MARCNNPKGWGYAEYGALGVTVCERWQRFEAFLEDMGERPAGKSIDRIDGSKGYEPGNCRWATRSEQNLNRRKYVITKRTARKGKSPGRPPLPANERSSARVGFRCTPQEKKGYKAKAKPLGVSAWLRKLADKA